MFSVVYSSLCSNKLSHWTEWSV